MTEQWMQASTVLDMMTRRWDRATTGLPTSKAIESMEASHEALKLGARLINESNDHGQIRSLHISGLWQAHVAKSLSDAMADDLGLPRALVWGVVDFQCCHPSDDIKQWVGDLEEWGDLHPVNLNLEF